jgi:ABC-type nitrate/sulfonate/bicarbonate transport system ATPase subunit
MTVLEAIDLTKTFVGGDGGVITVLDGVNLRVARGEMVAVVGASGAGKSTLLHLVGALDRPTRGAVVIGGALLSGGRGTIVGTIFGVLILTTLNNVLILNNQDSSTQAIAKGAIIIVAVLLQQRVAARNGGPSLATRINNITNQLLKEERKRS